jgi:predicted transcriptional regulator
MVNADTHTSISLRLPTALRERLQAQARAEDRSESGFIRYHLTRILEAESSGPVPFHKPKTKRP